MPRITRVHTVLLTGPCTNDRFLREARRLRSAAFIEIHTDAGVTGLGETYAGYFCPEMVPEIVAFFAPILTGQEIPLVGDGAAWVREMGSRMRFCGLFWGRVGLGAAVLTGIEAALWDLMGQLRNQSAWSLLGGLEHESLPCYATGGPSNYPKEKLAQKADYYLELGFRGFKVGAGKMEAGRFVLGGDTPAEQADFEADKMNFLARHCGRDVHLLLDGHMGNSTAGTWDLPTALAVAKALESCPNLFLLEEPLPYSDPQAYAELAQSVTTPIAGGECLTAMPEWLEYLRRDSFDIAQPDASWVGGLAEFMDIAHAFAIRGRRVATHAWGAGGSLMQNIHAAFACPNACMVEVPPDFADLHRQVMGDSFIMTDGRLWPPQTPGLGIRLTQAIKDRFPFEPGSGEFNSVPGKVLST